jgi:hypothetical protein
MFLIKNTFNANCWKFTFWEGAFEVAVERGERGLRGKEGVLNSE